GDLLCHVLKWLSQNELAAGSVLTLIGKLSEDASGLVGAIGAFVKEYAHSLIGLVGVTFGIWRWWRYREHILHKRLEEYLNENDARLLHGRDAILKTFDRPGPGKEFQEPLFVGSELRSVLREQRWNSGSLALTVEKSADLQLREAIGSILRRLQT